MKNLDKAKEGSSLSVSSSKRGKEIARTGTEVQEVDKGAKRGKKVRSHDPPQGLAEKREALRSLVSCSGKLSNRKDEIHESAKSQ